MNFFTSFIAVSLALACITSVQADYSFAVGTPGTQWGLAPQAPAVPATANALRFSRVFKSVGLTYAGVAAGAGAVMNTNKFDCGQIITDISATLDLVNIVAAPAVVVQPPPLAPGADGGAVLAHQHATAAYNTYVTNLALYQAARQMNAPVIGVAVVDYGTAAAPNVQAFLSRSGNAAPYLPQAALNFAASRRPANPLQTVANWHFVDTTTEDEPFVTAHRSPFRVTLPVNNVNDEAQDILDWGASASTQPNYKAPSKSEGILFGVGPTYISKKWPNGAGGAHTDRMQHRATCAMQKLMFNLFGMGPNGIVPGAFAPLLGNAQNQVDGAGRGRLVCAAESAHKTAGVDVKSWNNANVPYTAGQLIPSCVVCQSIVPEIVSGSLHPINCPAVAAVTDGTPGACGVGAINHGASCSINCNPGFQPQPSPRKCSFGTLSPQLCVPECSVANPITHVPTLGGHVVAFARNTQNGGLTGDHPILSHAGLPTCEDSLKPGHSCKIACIPLATAVPTPALVQCSAAGVLIGNAPVCQPACLTPKVGSEAATRIIGGDVTVNNQPCRGTLKFGVTCTPTCLPGQIPTNAVCGAGGHLSTTQGCAPAHVFVQTDSSVVTEEAIRDPIARLAKHRQGHSSTVLQP